MKLPLVMLTLAVTSMFIFPFSWTFVPGINTKMMMAVCGLLTFGIDQSMRRTAAVSGHMLGIAAYAVAMSLVCCLAVTINNTTDYAYTNYISSMLVWVGAAYFAVACIRRTHGQASIRLIVYYLTAVCVVQCLMALWIDFSPDVKHFVDGLIDVDQKFLNSYKVKRMYGPGANLDVAGSRFSAVLVMIACLFGRSRREDDEEETGFDWHTPLLIVSFAIITIVGNMISRTTLVGCVIAVGYMIVNTCLNPAQMKGTWLWMGAITLAIVPACIYFYNADPLFRHELRFGFEGFFKLVERGRWELSSTNKLKGMYVLPDNVRTWIIGDGYFSNPKGSLDYFGELTEGYYKNTDVGYLRFIFYCGTAGLLVFMAFFGKVTQVCWARFAAWRWMFVLLLAVNFTVWFKVSTDIFLMFAPFLMLDDDENEDPLLHTGDT